MPSEVHDTKRERTRGVARVLGAGACALVAFVVAHVGLHSLALHFERGGASLWWQEQHLRLFMRSNYAPGDRPRLLFTGSSEAREGFDGETFAARFPEWRTDQNAWIWATLPELVLGLEYLERAYGDDALPEALVVGITPRYVADLRESPSPFYSAINRYSPRFRVEFDDAARQSGPHLVERPWREALRARINWFKHQGNRYRGAWKGVLRAGLVSVAPDRAESARLRTRLVPQAFHQLSNWPPELTRQVFLEPDAVDARYSSFAEHVRNMRAWNPDDDADAIRAAFAAVLEIAERHGIRLFFVSLPEVSWSRDGFGEERYARYLRVLSESVGEAPLLDLRDLLRDDEFHDHQHANRAGALRLTARVSDWLAPQLKQ